MDDSDRTAILSLVGRQAFVSVSTLDGDGYPDARTMFNLRWWRAPCYVAGPAVPPGPLHEWIGTNTSSRKVAQVRADGRACLLYADTVSSEGLSVKGRFEECLDPAVRAALWDPSWERYYEGGLEGGDYTVLRFVPESGRYYHGLRVLDFPVGALGATGA